MQHESRLAVAEGFTFMKTNCLGGTFVRHSCFDKLCGSHHENSKENALRCMHVNSDLAMLSKRQPYSGPHSRV